MALDALAERYSYNELTVVNYHLHIPMPDPMTNPSTLVRAELCAVRGTPSFAVDGEMKSGGGGRDEAEANYQALNTKIEERLNEPAEARMALDAFYKDGSVFARVAVDEVANESSQLKLQIALVEEELSYSGQNNIRFHPMVVRSLGGEGHLGYSIDPARKTTIEQSFDLKEVVKELEQHLADLETEREMTFIQKKYEIDRRKLSVVAFVEDVQNRQVLQAAYMKVE